MIPFRLWQIKGLFDYSSLYGISLNYFGVLEYLIEHFMTNPYSHEFVFHVEDFPSEQNTLQMMR
ncbi:hypothetical protein TRIP_C20048 [Candidatus Zixiibacteriota bacterium]|nr:hypothetical protein TRIP_C20048 [candidate division Zixibacteria bacterium]